MRTTKSDAELPNAATAELARAGASQLGRWLQKAPEAVRLQVADTDVTLPGQALVLLRDLLAEMGRGNAVTIGPRHAKLTTQQAANLLNISRPHVVKLLEQGTIPYFHVGTHRRIRYQDVIAYKAERDQQCEEAVDALTREGQGLGMGYQKTALSVPAYIEIRARPTAPVRD